MARRRKRRRRLGHVRLKNMSSARKNAEAYCKGVYGSGLQSQDRVRACINGVRTALQFVMNKEPLVS